MDFYKNINKGHEMISKYLTFFMVFISITVFGQREIKNEMTVQHQNIKGTKLSLIAPKGFAEGLNFRGFQ
jgi:hypothetical protein